MTRLTLAALSLALFCATTMAEATPTPCSAGLPRSDNLNLSDVTFRGSAADDCFGVQPGNDSGAHGASIGWNGFEQLLSDSSGDAVGASRSWMGLTWSLSGATNARNGGYSLNWTPTKLPLALDLIFVVKASDRFVSYLFNQESFTSAVNSGGGSWQVGFRNGGNQIPKLSHLSIWARVAPVTVAEPGTLGLLSLGLVATAAIIRKRREAVAKARQPLPG